MRGVRFGGRQKARFLPARYGLEAQATIDVDAGAIDVVVTDYEGDGVGDLIRLRETP